jgi:hypothetical protein
MAPARSRLILFSAAIATLAAVLAVLLPAGIASAATGPAAETRVWAFSPAAQVHVRADRPVSADQRQGDPASCPFYASGSCAAPEAVINEGVNSVSNIGAGAAARSAETIAQAEPGGAFSGVYDPGSGQLSAYPSVRNPAAPGSPVNAVAMRGGHGVINNAVFGGSNSTVGFTAFVEDGSLSVGWRSGSVNFANFGQIEAPMEYRQAIMDVLGNLTGLPVWSR